MKMNEVDFAEGFVERFKTEKDFLEEMQDGGYSHIFHGPHRQEKLKEAYAAHHKKPDKTSSDKPEVSTK